MGYQNYIWSILNVDGWAVLSTLAAWLLVTKMSNHGRHRSRQI